VDVVVLLNAALRPYLEALAAAVRIESPRAKDRLDGTSIGTVEAIPPGNDGPKRHIPSTLACPPREKIDASRIPPEVLNALSLQQFQDPIEILIGQITSGNVIAPEEKVL
jgi:hypothetical protein